MTDEKKINEEQNEQVSGGSGFAVPDKIDKCPYCGSDNVMFDKSDYNVTNGIMTYHFYCWDCRQRFQRN